MEYYKLMIENEDGAVFDHVAVENLEELERYKQAFSAEFEDKYAVTAIPVTVRECLEEEERELDNRLFCQYFRLKYVSSEISESEYESLRERFKGDPEFRWQALRELADIEERREKVNRIIQSLIETREFRDYWSELLAKYNK